MSNPRRKQKYADKWATGSFLKEGFVEPLRACALCLWTRRRAGGAYSVCTTPPRKAALLAEMSEGWQKGTTGKSGSHISRSETASRKSRRELFFPEFLCVGIDAFADYRMSGNFSLKFSLRSFEIRFASLFSVGRKAVLCNVLNSDLQIFGSTSGMSKMEQTPLSPRHTLDEKALTSRSSHGVL